MRACLFVRACDLCGCACLCVCACVVLHCWASATQRTQARTHTRDSFTQSLTLTHARTRTQDGKTSLVLACEKGQEGAAEQLAERTAQAGALDVQAGYEKRSALQWASARGMAGTVATLLSLGADPALADKVRTHARSTLLCVCVHRPRTHVYSLAYT